MVRELVAAALAALLVVSGCGAQPEAPAFNATDVMFAQMALAQIDEGSQVTSLVLDQGSDPRVRTIATELRDQWASEARTMSRWLQEWHQPAVSTASHDGHGDLHVLRPSDIGELRSAQGKTFDRTAVSLLLGHLGNCVETARMESAGGAYPPARELGETVTRRRQTQIQRLLALAAEP